MKKEYGLAMVAVILWSTLSPVTKIVLNTLPNMEVLCVASFVAFLFLLALNLIKRKFKGIRDWKAKDYLTVCGLGFLGLFLYSALYYYGISVMSAQDACIINYLWPLMIVLFSIFVLKEKMNFRKAIAVLISFVGVVLVATKGNFTEMDMTNLKGIISCMGAAVCYGIFSVYNKKKAYDQNISMMFFFGVSALFAGVCSLLTEERAPIASGQFLGILWIGVFVNAIGYLSWCLALNRGETAQISNLAYITPFLAMVLSHFMLGEELSIWSFSGLVLIIGGILIQVHVKTGQKV